MVLRAGLLFLVLLVLSGVSGCAFFGVGESDVAITPSSSPAPLPLIPLAAQPEIRITLVKQDDFGANLLLASDWALREDVWVYLRISSADTDGDIFKVFVPAGGRGRPIAFPRELFLSTPTSVQVFPCQDECYKPVGEPVSLFN